MYVSAVISEFNPFHYGHQYLIDNIRKNGTTHIVSVMSGNFVQRGEPAILSKWARTEIVLNSGVDLVIEIPVAWSISTAEKYAFAGIRIADSLGCVDTLYFGSECGDVSLLSKISDVLLTQDLFNLVKSYLKQGITYAKARELAIVDCLGSDYGNIIRQPNNILAIEYIKALRKINSHIKVCTIPRKGAAHDSTNTNSNNIVSASAIRHYIKDGKDFKDFVPEICKNIIDREIYSGNAPSDLIYTERAILAKLRSMGKNDIINLPDVSEGIENRIINAVGQSGTLEDLYCRVKTKRYTMSRVRRIVLSAFLGISKDIEQIGIPYIRVLGFNERGKEILKLIKKSAILPIVTGFADIKKLDERCAYVFEKECKTSDLYSLMLPKVSDCNLDKTSKIIVVK